MIRAISYLDLLHEHLGLDGLLVLLLEVEGAVVQTLVVVLL